MGREEVCKNTPRVSSVELVDPESQARRRIGAVLAIRKGTPSYSGYIGLKGDSDDTPKRSFFWYFGTESRSADAPVILTMGGGPGTSGLMNAFFGQSPCLITAQGLVSNPNGWTERYNLIVLDHPIGAGFSYDTRVNNSRSAAFDVYDFLQKFYVMFPGLAEAEAFVARNRLVVAGGSYGGTYVPHIATVIQEGNRAVALGKGQPGAKHINLESLMIHNPFTDPYSHFRWLLQYRCVYHDVYNSTTCRDLYAVVPKCLEALDFANELQVDENPESMAARARRHDAIELCAALSAGYTNDTASLSRWHFDDELIFYTQCHKNDDGDPSACFPEFRWMREFFGSPDIKAALGVPPHINYTSLNLDVAREFSAYGEKAFRHHHLYEPLLTDGIRVLHYVGAQDANCAWPGVLSFLKLIRSPFQQEFLNTEDVPWPKSRREEGYVRKAGEGAGNMTFMLIEESGHFNVHDQPALVKDIVEHWIENKAFVWSAGM